MASNFLLNYSEKLWGLPAARLSTSIAATRLKGLDLKTFLLEAVSGSGAKTEHLDGSFYYPHRGAGEITEVLAAGCGAENIRTGTPVTRIIHGKGRIEELTVGEGEPVEAGEVSEHGRQVRLLALQLSHLCLRIGLKPDNDAFEIGTARDEEVFVPLQHDGFP